MKATYACLTGSPRRIEFRERELVLGEDQVLVRISACGMCRYDAHLLAEEDGPAELFGHEAVGQVVARGSRARRFAEGDWVVGGIPFGFGNVSAAAESDLCRVPPELAELASLAEPLKCVTTVVRAAAPDFADTVVVVGCGFMGLAAIAAMAGNWVGRLIALDPVAARREHALRIGATDALDPQGLDTVARVRAIAGGRGADVAIEFAGSPDAAALAAGLLHYRGTLVVAGGFTPSQNIYMRAITLHLAPPMFSADPMDDYRRTVALMAAGRLPLHELATHRFKLSHVAEAFAQAHALGPSYLKGIVINDMP
jgi:S-(hydroxymethyl)glutathione dehydrogenase/alcohol dehydrogenase